MYKRIHDYDIKDNHIFLTLNYSFPLWLDNNKLLINVSLDIDKIYSSFYYSILFNDIIFQNIICKFNRLEIEEERIIHNISTILEKHFSFNETNTSIIYEKFGSYNYKITIRKDKIKDEIFNYDLTIEITGNEKKFSIGINFKDKENGSKIYNVSQMIMFILENLNTIEEEIKKSVGDIVMEKVNEEIGYWANNSEEEGI